MKRLAAIALFFLFGILAHAQTLSGVQVSPFGSVLQSGTEQFTATCLYTNGTTDNCAGKTVTWYSSEPDLATVNSSGLATYVGNCGTGAYGAPQADSLQAWSCWAHMVATVDGFSDYATIFLQFPSDTFQVLMTPSTFTDTQGNQVPATLAVGSTATFGAGAGIDGAVQDVGANPFPACNWTSSNTAVGTINRNGFFTAISPGTAVVTCGLAGNGVYDASQTNFYTVTVVAGGTGGNTWYIRPDGGTPYVSSALTPAGQCSGLVNAPYPGNGVNQPCALGDFEDLYFDQVNNGRDVWMINGGDTVIVEPKATGYHTAMITANTPANCADFEYCDVPSIPSGTAAQPTRILGSNYANCTGSYGPDPAMTTLLLGYGREVLSATLSQFVDVECFEVADESASNGFSYGLVQSAFTSYATFKNVFIHNANYSGVLGATGIGVTDDHLHIRAAHFAGYNMDDFPYGISNISVAGGLTMTNSNVEFTGCHEIYGSTAEYPFVANGCLDENTGGQGDGFGTGSMTGTWLFDHDIFRYNFQDGLDSLHSGAQSETVINSQSYGNDGDQFKFGDVNVGVFQNNFAMGNCNRILQPFNGVTIAVAGVNPCRAGGDVIVFEFSNDGGYTVQNNTMIGVGNPIILYQCESTWSDCSQSNTILQNNSFAGYTGSDYSYSSGIQPHAFYLSGSSPTPPNNGFATRSNNDFYNVASYAPLLSGEIAVDPLFISEPPFLTELTDNTESILDNYNAMPNSSSPMLGAGIHLSGLSLDANGVAYTNPPPLGALEYVAPPVVTGSYVIGAFLGSGSVIQ